MTQRLPDKPAREIELKLAVPDGELGAILQHKAFRASGAGQERRHEITTYFDTRDQALARSGVSLRVRDTNGRRVQTLKADSRAGVAADRAEWEWPIDRAKPDLGLLAQTPIAERLPRRLDLRAVLVTDIERTVRMLEPEQGTIVEAALDQGTIIAGKARQAVRELELELRQGDAAPLFRLALELHAAAPLTIESQSKAARGYRLAGGPPPTASKGGAVVLRRTTSGAEALRAIVNAQLGHLLANQPAALSGDAEAVHQMRVAIRRLRAALTLFEPLLQPNTASCFQAALRRVGQVFGEARDWDVFVLQVLPDALSDVGAEHWCDLLRDPATARREAAHVHFAEEVLAPPFTALVLGLAAWIADADRLGDAALRRPIEALYPRLLDRLAGKVGRRGRRIRHRSDSERHALRKSLKKLRYGIDYLETVLPRKAAKSYLRKCKKVQGILGDINDAVTAVALADHLGDGGRPDLVPAIGAFSEQMRRRRDHGLHRLVKRWKAFRAEPRAWT
jgi:triphosphatase